MKIKKNTEDFIEEAKKVHPGFDYSKVNYVSSKTEVIIGCPKHGDFKILPNRFIDSIYGCKKCIKRTRQLDSNTAIKQIKQLFPNYKFPNIEKLYKTTMSRINVICPIHGEYSTSANTLLKGCECRECYNIKNHNGEFSQRLSDKEVIEKIKNEYPNLDCSKIKNYKNYESPITIGCPIHGFFNTSLYQLFSTKEGCMKCHKETTKQKRIESETKKIIDIGKHYHPDYTYNNMNYIDNNTKVLVTCPKHGDFEIFPYNIKKGRGCPYCQESKGEVRIRSYLNSSGIHFLAQKRFEDFRQYPYDFYLPLYNTLIEYNGEQHYKELPYFYNGRRKKKTFTHRQEIDAKKKEYAEKNGYKLLVIPYTDFDNIESILEKTILPSA